MANTYVNFSNNKMKTAVLACLDTDDKLVFWCEYNTKNYVCVFHNNSSIIPSAIDGKTAHVVSDTEARMILTSCMNATVKTTASRYAGEIDEFLRKEWPYILF